MEDQKMTNILHEDIQKIKNQLQIVGQTIAGMKATCIGHHSTNLHDAIVKHQTQITHIKQTLNKITKNLTDFNNKQNDIINNTSKLSQHVLNVEDTLTDLSDTVDEQILDINNNFDDEISKINDSIKTINDTIVTLQATVNQLVLCQKQIQDNKLKNQDYKKTITTAVIASIIIGILSWLGSAAVNTIFKDSFKQPSIEKNINQKQ